MYERPRVRMVQDQLQDRGIRDVRVLDVMTDIPRHLFVEDAMVAHAYADRALPIGEAQTISQPYMVARMSELLELQGNERVLEIGTGSGYQTAVLSKLCKRVYSIERIQPLYEKARKNLRRARCASAMLMCGDGAVGWATYAPFDAILVTAGVENVPGSWVDQLKDGGVMVLPVGTDGAHTLVRRKKLRTGMQDELLEPCTFVPFIPEVEIS